MPRRVRGRPARRWIGAIHHLLLDCSDQARRHRIEQRPTWRSRDVDEQTRFGQWLRDNIIERADTELGTPDATAEAVAQ